MRAFYTGSVQCRAGTQIILIEADISAQPIMPVRSQMVKMRKR